MRMMRPAGRPRVPNPRLPDTLAAPDAAPSLRQRLLSRRAAQLLARNTVVSIGVFLFGLALLWALVERLGAPAVPAAGLSFLVSHTIHYVFGRTWIFRGTERKIAAGYFLFLLNSLVGLGITVSLFALFVAGGLHYLVARIVVSVFAGLALFVLNAVLNFRSL